MNYANSTKITPFLSACVSGDKSLCELLLARGAELTAKSSNLTTALHCAAYGGHTEICELLISTGIKPLTIDRRDIVAGSLKGRRLKVGKGKIRATEKSEVRTAAGRCGEVNLLIIPPHLLQSSYLRPVFPLLSSSTTQVT